MRLRDIVSFALGALRGYRTRTALMLLAMAIGVSAVMILTALGEGARRFVVGEFASLGTNLVIVLPGRSESAGGPAGLVGETTRDLTTDDATALKRHPAVTRVAPIVVGTAPVSWGPREREVPIIGSSTDLLTIRHWKMAKGDFLPASDLDRATPVCVVGAKVSKELFGTEPALGQWLRIGDRRFRVVGLLATEGRSIGVDVEELVIVPVASAQALMNTESLFRILVEVSTSEAIPKVKAHILATIRDRHQGEEDITVVTQDAVLETFDRIFQALTYTVAGIAAISLAVAGILIMNVMLVSVSQRTAEVGLLKALGTPSKVIQGLFLTEAALLSLFGASLGLIIGEFGSWALARIYPLLPAAAPWWAVAASLGVALLTGVLFGVMPARRAAKLDPVQALLRR